MDVVGLTGGVGTGKSTVAAELRTAHRIPVIDVDQLAHEVLQEGTRTQQRVRHAFGDSIAGDDGSGIDRMKLAQLVFQDASKRAKLNSIVHPAIAFEIAWRLLEHWVRGDPIVVLDAPLLFETGLNRITGATIVVTASPEQQRARFAARTGCTEAHADARIAAQRPLSWKVQQATHLVDNGGALEETRRQVADVVHTLKAKVSCGGWKRTLRSFPAVLGVALSTLVILAACVSRVLSKYW